MTTTTTERPPASAPGRAGMSVGTRRVLWLTTGLVVLSVARLIHDAPDLTSSGTMGAALRLGIPIGFAGLGGIFAERVGVVNIGLEGMMILGTWFGAYGAWQFGPWWGLALGVFGGAIGGLAHAISTVTFNVDHIISGVAVNIMAAGLARYLSVLAYDKDSGGGATQSPRRSGSISRVDVPWLADTLGDIEKKHWFLISDVAGLSRGFMASMSLATIVAALLVVGAGFLLWRTRFGLRLRSIGENPYAAESLGVPVQRIRYAGVILSGMSAGFGGAYLSVVHSSIYKEGQTAGKGFIGLATMIFGNWRPGGLVSGSILFGYSDALQLRSSKDVPALLGVVAVVCFGVAILMIRRRRPIPAALSIGVGIIFGILFFTVDEIPGALTFATPHVVTLVVLATASQRLRGPAAAGQPYRPGEGH